MIQKGSSPPLYLRLQSLNRTTKYRRPLAPRKNAALQAVQCEHLSSALVHITELPQQLLPKLVNNHCSHEHSKAYSEKISKCPLKQLNNFCVHILHEISLHKNFKIYSITCKLHMYMYKLGNCLSASD